MINQYIMFFITCLGLALSGCGEQEKQKNELWQTCYSHYRAESYLVAKETCQHASDKGIVGAQWLLGHIYYYDLASQSTTREQGFNFYLKAAENEWPEAQTFVGESYMYADGVAEDFEKAFFWLNKAARFQDPNAEFAIGMLFYDGKGREKDISSAIAWFKKAAEKQHLMSINNLAWIYATSEHQAFRNIDKALYWVKALEPFLRNISQQDSIFLDTKAAVMALSNNFETAISLQNQAISLLPEDVEEARLIEYQKHLEAYKSNQAWLETNE